MAGFLFVLALLAAIIATWRHKQWAPVSFGLLWFLLAELPTSLYPLSEVENDHRMFFGFVGLMLSVVWAVWRGLQVLTTPLRRTRIRPWIVASVVILLGAYANGTRIRNRVWHDEASLWLDDVQKSPHNGRGLMNYGLTRMAAGDNAGALTWFNRALQYTPNYATLEINLGIATGELGYAREAEQHFLRAIALAPTDDQPQAYYGRWLRDEARTADAIQQLNIAVALNPTRPFDHEQLLQALSESGDTVALVAAANATLIAIPHDSVAEQMLAHPTLPDAAWWVNRSLALYQRGDFAASISAANRALALDPHSAEAHNNLGATFAAMGEYPTAIAEEKTALTLAPNFRIAQNNLAAFTASASQAGKPTTAADWINRSLALYQSAKYEDSLQAAREALKLDPMSAIAWNNIAAANASLQRWPEAIAAAHRALTLKPDFQLAQNNLAWAQSQQAAAH
jgi:tetratricopeptide (TPR) repeat protein